MEFQDTAIPGVCEVLLERQQDVRGYFARNWCSREFSARGLPGTLVQSSVSQNSRKGTLRGLHFQRPPSREGKLVRCEQGSVFDVALDLRPDSPSFLRHFSVILDSKRGNGLYIPPGVAHGFQSLVDETRVLYLMSDFFAPELAEGVRYDDSAFDIHWPLDVSVIAARDLGYPDFDHDDHALRIGNTALWSEE